MKIFDTVNKTSLSGEYDVRVQFNTPDNEPRALFRAVGNDSVKVAKLAVSAAIVAAGTIVMRNLRKTK